MKLMAKVAFTAPGDELDPDRAADELRQAGYTVHRLPSKYSRLLFHPCDDFFEVIIDGEIIKEGPDPIVHAVMREVDHIVSKFGGTCWEGGPVEHDHVPFTDLF